MGYQNTSYTPVIFLAYGMLFFSGHTLVESFNSGVSWKIVFSLIAFTVFLGLAGIYTKGLYQVVFEEKNSS